MFINSHISGGNNISVGAGDLESIALLANRIAVTRSSRFASLNSTCFQCYLCNLSKNNKTWWSSTANRRSICLRC